jgi:uncharacterized protein YbaA (DUF1428 family)
MPYVDGFLLAVPNAKLDDYKKLAKKAGKIWLEYGALEYRECVSDDLDVKMGVSFAKPLKLKPDESAVFSWIVYKSRAQRDRVNAKVMKDPRIAAMCTPENTPFDMKRMHYGGFKVLVEF